MRTRHRHATPFFKHHALAFATAAVLGPLAALPASAATCTWNTTNGNWNALANWLACATGNGNPGGVPGGADTAVIGAGGVVTVSTGQAINTLNNAGTVSVLDGVSFSFDARSAAASFSGGGQLVLGGPGSRLYVEGNNGMSLGAGSTIRGAGQIGQAVQQSGASTFTNAGTISADSAGQSLILVPPSNSGSYANQALMEARNGGTLDLRSTVAQGASGQLRAEAGSTVLLNGAAISGGLLSTAGTGRIAASNSFGNVLSGVTLAGVLDLAGAASQARIDSGLTFSGGRIDVGAASVLYFDNRGTATQGITGTGSINMAGGALRFEGAGQTTTGANITIRGHGLVGQAVVQSGLHRWVNNGLVSADVSGQTMNLVPVANGGLAIQNNGILEAINGGRLLLSTDIDAATGSQMRAGAGSVIEMNGVRVTGTVNTTGTGSFRASNNFNNVLSGVALNGTMDLASQASQLRVSEGLVLNGSIDVGGSTLFIDNRGTPTQGITGTGSINMAGGAMRFEGTGQTTTGANITIRGHGLVGQAVVQSGLHRWVNNGLVSADVSGQTMNLVPVANGGLAIQNNGILEAINGGRLLLSTDIDAATGSQMRAGAGSVIEMNGVRVTGTVNTTGTGSFRASNNFNNVLSGVTLNGAMDLASQASQLRVSEGLVLNGSIDVGGSTLFVDNRGTATQAITGTGSIQLAGGALRMEGAGQTSFGAGTTLRGYGSVGQGVVQTGSQLLINNGTIRADVSGQTLSIAPIANGAVPIQNNGTMQALGGGVLQLNTSVTGGALSRFDVDAGSQIVMNGVTFAGVVNQTGTGAITASNNSNNLLSAATFNGRINAGSAGAGQLRVADSLTMNGGASINVGSGGVLSFDNRGTAVQAVSGNGQIVMAGGAMRFEGGSSTTWGSGVTVRGSGSIGQAVSSSANQTLFNNGTVIADGGALNIVSIANAGALQGTGTLRVDGGALSLGTGRTTLQGTLDMRATGTLALGNQNLVLSSDYTNAQAGSGNSFNRRAGVTGTGQIVAGGDVAQVITGAAISNGATTNATLTIGSVRVGANTFSYGIGNAGTTGPTLRGAVQTAVNGGNLTDSRLSGGGVTAGNYNAGAPGGGSGPQSVVFTAASAGALAPLTGQVLNLRSNFENVADQKLNIVLAGGAAAYNAAVGNTTPAPAVVANQRVGGSGSTALTVANTAAAGAFSEDLRASFGANGGAASNNGGVVNTLLAGASNSSALRVGVDTGSAGAKSGSVTINYQTTGTVAGVSNGLGLAGANAPQVVAVTGNVYQTAAGSLQTAPMNFGTIQVGQVRTQDLVLRNTATGAAGFVEDLNAAFGASGNGQISGAGALNGILAGTNSTGANGLMRVTVNATTVGALSSSIAVNYSSAGAVAGVSNGLGTLAVGSQDYGVSGIIEAVGTVINQASPLVNTPTLNLGAVRVGAAAPSGAVSVTNVATASPQAALNASIASTTGPITGSGSFSLLNPGATNASSLVVALNTGTAGNFTGAAAGKATINFVSDASNVGGCAPGCTLDLASQVVNVEGKVYTQAVGQLATAGVNFGVVRVGDTVSAANITINNTAAVSALNDTLRADLGGVAGPFTSGGSVGGIAAQGSGLISVGLNTSAAGIYSRTGTVGFTSQNADMADVSAGADAVLSMFAQVNNLANADFDLLSGAGSLTQSGFDYVLDLGNVVLGSTVGSVLQLDNDVAGPADSLSGLFDLSAADDFSLTGWGPLGPLAAGAASGALNVNWLAGALGTFSDSIVFNGLGTNASDTTGLAQMRRLFIRANVVDVAPPGTVPEPGTLALLMLAGGSAWWARRRALAARSAA